MKTKTIGILCMIVVVLTFYFVFSVFYLPDIFQSFKKPIPIPHLSKVSISESNINYGDSFYIEITGTNLGDSADIQIVSIGFPNLTSADNHVSITSYDFKQSPFIIEINDMVGKNYASSSEEIPAVYPSIEAYSRPWKPNENYHIGLEVIPEEEGRFVIYVKAVGLPHTSNQSHIPTEGMLDYQNEFVSVYSILVSRP